MVNILIVNFSSRLSKGCAALLNSKIKLLTDLIPRVKFTVATHRPEVNYTQHNICLVEASGKIYLLRGMIINLILLILCCLNLLSRGLLSKSNISIKGYKLNEYVNRYNVKRLTRDLIVPFITLYLLFRCTLWAVLHRLGLNVNRSFCGKRLQEYYDADVVLNTGGDTLTEEVGPYSNFVNLLFAILLDKPVIICAESIGPFKNKLTIYIARYILNGAKLIAVREERSLKYLQEIKVNRPPIYLTVDVAYTLEPSSEQETKEILKKERIDVNIHRPLIGISASKAIAYYGFSEFKNRKDKYDEYVKLMSRVINYLVDTLNATIVFIPHVIDPIGNDDRIVADDICRLIKNKNKIISIKEDYTPEELKGVIGQCDLFIGARMHACVASTSMRVPTVAIAYGNKTHGVIGEMLGQEKYILDVRGGLKYDNLIPIIEDAWKNRKEIKKDLEIRMSAVKKRALLNGKLIKDLLDSLDIT